MECFSGDVNRMECGGGEVGGWVDGEVGVDRDRFGLGLSLVEFGLRRLCVMSATIETCCKCNTFIQNHAPG